MKTLLPILGAFLVLSARQDADLERRVASLERDLARTDRLVGVLIEGANAETRAKALKVMEANVEERREEVTRAIVEALAEALDAHRKKHGAWPASLRELDSDIKRTDDAWGRPLVYRPDDRVLYSVGRNGKDDDGKGDDIR